MNIRQIFGLLAAIACAGSVQAQRVGWEADFKTRFDNREFTGSSCNESQTIFLADLSTAVSYNWLDRNTLRFGVQMQKDFGDNRDYFSEVRPLASYAYRAVRLGTDVGIFSRDQSLWIAPKMRNFSREYSEYIPSQLSTSSARSPFGLR